MLASRLVNTNGMYKVPSLPSIFFCRQKYTVYKLGRTYLGPRKRGQKRRGWLGYLSSKLFTDNVLFFVFCKHNKIRFRAASKLANRPNIVSYN